MAAFSKGGLLSLGGALSKGGMLSKGGPFAHGTGGVPGPYPAPSGFRWEYVTDNGQLVTDGGALVVDLVRTN